jgi:hypothetical protein
MTEIIFILDRSGSMEGLEKDTIGGFNSMMKKQASVPGDALVSTLLFDNDVEVIHDRLNIKDVPEMTSKEYYVRGCTALLDAVGGAIKHISMIHKYARKEDVPEKTLFIITTDGMENASRRYSYEDVRSMVEHQKSKHGWEFIFLGANIDAAAEASRYGIDSSMAVNYNCDSKGMEISFKVMDDVVSSYRSTCEVPKEWRKLIDDDFKSRRKF